MPPRAMRRAATALCLGLTLGTPAAGSFVTFESGQVRPLALSPNGTKLFAVNTPDNRLEIFNVVGGSLSHAGSVPVGMEPVAVAARTDAEVWVINHLSDSASIVDVASVPPRVVRTVLLCDEPRDIVFAGPGGGPTFTRAFITAARRGQNCIDETGAPIDPLFTTEGTGRAVVQVFDATSLGSSLGGTPLRVIMDRGVDDTLFGDTPRALAATADGSTVLAAVFHSGNRTTALNAGLVCDGGAGAGPCTVGGSTMPGGLPAPNTNLQGDPQPEVGLIVRFSRRCVGGTQPGTACSISGDCGAGGSCDSHWYDKPGEPDPRIWDNGVRFSLPDRDVFAIDATASPPGETASAPGVGTVIFNMVVNPVSSKVYVSNTEARNEVRFEGPGTFGGSTVRGHLHEARITVLDLAGVHPRHLNKHITYDVIPDPDPDVNDKSLATPLGMAVTSDGSTLYVAAFGSSKIGVFNTALLESDDFVPNEADHIPVSGGGPTGLLLNAANTRLYVLTRFDNSILVIDTATRSTLADLPLHNPEPASVVQGRPFLYDARLTSNNGEASCASCHIFGDFDSLGWDLGNPDDPMLNNLNPLRPGIPGDPDFHPMKGPMTTQSLRGMANHGPMHWRGDRTGGLEAPSVQPDGGAFDEGAAFAKFNVAFAGLLGRSGPLVDDDMQAFTDFILQVTYPPNPVRALTNTLNTDQQAGSDFFFNSDPSDTVGTCNFCHVLSPASGFFGTDGFSVIEPQTTKIPHLRNVYQKVGMFGMPLTTGLLGFNPGNNGFTGDQVRGFGFLHDGSVDSLFRFFNLVGFNQSGGNPGGFTSDVARRQMEQYMLAFDSNLAPIVGQQITLTSGNAATVGPRINLLIARATVGECEVIVKGNLGGEQRGWWRTAAGTFRSDWLVEPLITDASLRAQAGSTGQERTYTCVPPGSGERLGVERDGDGFYDQDEVEAGSDPADPFSIPVGCTSGLSIAGARFKVRRNLAPAGDEKLVARGEWSLGTLPIDPATNGISIRVDSQSGVQVYSRVVPGGALWTANAAGTRWRYRDPTGLLAGGITSVVVTDRSASTPGLHRIRIIGKDSDFQVAPGEVPVGLQLFLGGAAGQCATRAFAPAGGAPPACTLSTSGNLLTCR